MTQELVRQWVPQSVEQVFAPNGVACSVYLTADQAITTGSFNKVAFTGKAFDPFGYWDATNYRFKPTVPGYYRVSCSLSLAANSSGQQVLAVLYKNGAVYRRLDQFTQTVSGFSNVVAQGSCLVYLNGTSDYVELYGYANVSPISTGTGGEVWTSADFELVAASVGVAPEPIHVVGATGEPAFQNSWRAEVAGYTPPSFYKNPDGTVFVRGEADPTNVAAGIYSSTAIIFTLPAGYRPANLIRVPGLHYTSLNVNGLVWVNPSGAVAYTDLNQNTPNGQRAARIYATFRAEA